jgi:chemotaxis protein CheY-P-specific phosphatase CheC
MLERIRRQRAQEEAERKQEVLAPPSVSPPRSSQTLPTTPEGEIELDESQIESLEILQGVAVGKTVEGLMGMIPKKIKISVVNPVVIPIETITKMVRSDEFVNGLCFNISGDAVGYYLIILRESDARSLIGIMLDQPDVESLSRQERFSVIKEFGNILCSTNLNEISKIQSITLSPSAPVLISDSMGSIIDFTVSGAKAWNGQFAIATILKLMDGGNEIPCFFYLIPSVKMLEILL